MNVVTRRYLLQAVVSLIVLAISIPAFAEGQTSKQGGIAVDMVAVPAGSFEMGRRGMEEPVHTVPPGFSPGSRRFFTVDFHLPFSPFPETRSQRVSDSALSVPSGQSRCPGTDLLQLRLPQKTAQHRRIREHQAHPEGVHPAT